MRPAPLVLAAVLLMAASRPAAAQIKLEAPGGWTFTFAGNVSAFYIFETESDDGAVSSPGTIVGIGRRGSAVRSGYLPAFAVFDAKRLEGSTTVGVHFGFAPQIQTTGGHDDTTGAGARIDMRQVYLTASGNWGQVLAGREIGVFGRQSLLTDMSLFGTGATGGNFGNPGVATLGRSGFGYIYPGFNAQMTYSTPSGRPIRLTAGVFDPSSNNEFTELALPRLESELTWSTPARLVWIGAMLQRQVDTTLDRGATAWAGTAGMRLRTGAFSITASAFIGRGAGVTTLFRDGRSASSGSTRLRQSAGYLGQATWTRLGSPLTLGASYGGSVLRAAESEPDFRTWNRSMTGGIYFQATPSLRAVGEVTHAWSDDLEGSVRRNMSTAVAAGLMLFF